MPEYLAPGVYVEEVDRGPKPIEGVSTSTAGMAGMTERGPTDVPILVTSVGEFERWFGGILDEEEFVDGTGRRHCYLPHAIEGFFTNGGKRVYVVRVTPPEAARAETAMFWADPAVDEAESVLLRVAPQGTGMAPQELIILEDTLLAGGDIIRVGDGSASEYMTVNGAPAAADQHVPLTAALIGTHPAATPIIANTPAAPAGVTAALTLPEGAARGARVMLVDCTDDLVAASTAASPNGLPWIVQIDAGDLIEVAIVTAVEEVATDRFRFEMNRPLLDSYPVAQAIDVFQSSTTASGLTLGSPTAAGEFIIFANTTSTFAAGDLIELEPGTANHEAFAVGSLARLTFTATPTSLPAGTAVRHVALTDNALAAKRTTAAALAGSRSVSLDSRDGLSVGDLVRIGPPTQFEFAHIVAIPGDPSPGPNPGTITLEAPLSRAFATNAVVQLQDSAAGGNDGSRLIFGTPAGATTAVVAGGDTWAVGDIAQLAMPDGIRRYVRMTVASTAPANVSIVTLSDNLLRTHAVGEGVAERQQLFQVQALDTGAWGNRLRVSVQNEARGLADTTVATLSPPLQFTVRSLTGLEPGSLIELRNPATGAPVRLKVRRVDRSSSTVVLEGTGLDPATLASLGPITADLELRSVEFKLTVYLRRRPDPAVPSRNSLILASESFPHLSMDHRHSRYFQRIIGSINGPLRLEDNRPEGESAFIRVLDSVQDTGTEGIRPGPETLVDVLPGNLVQPARHALRGGDDSLLTMSNDAYLGDDNIEPRLRTGLASLRNLPEVSLVAIPGQTQPEIQTGLITHCELMRYRFAILDSDSQNASITQVRLQRQQFDTKYAALYYPWLTIPDPTPANLANIGLLALPPSGHVLGLIARVDNERGVHKAPANEVVRGVTGITRVLQKAEHDILNPSPVNVNVIRDFRPDGRSIRLFGARCITSDQEHKYVNVRRLLIFIEQSIERGLQWVVFEPNAEPLWARVEQSVGNFLTDVWNAGALEGTEPTQGFFVKCDRTTMTQSQIDNGQLVVVVGVAPVKPAEFVIIRIGLSTRTAEAA
jgi:phage tail sheath protein FI